MRTREQEYAMAVFTQVTAVKTQYGENAVFCKKYGAMAHKLPVLIRTAGLAQTLAFLETRKGSAETRQSNPYARLLNDLAAVAGKAAGKTTGAALAQYSREAPLGAYMRLTQQALAALVWYKRYAESVLNVQAGTDVPEEDAAETLTAPAVAQEAGA